MVTLITCLPARSPREPLQQALRTRAWRARSSRPLLAEAHARAPWGEREQPHPRPPAPRRSSCQWRARLGQSQRALSTVISAGLSPPPPAPPPPPKSGVGPAPGAPLVSAPRPPAVAPKGPARWVCMAQGRPLPPHPHLSDPTPLPLAAALEGGGCPESWSAPLHSSGDRGYLWISRPGWGLFVHPLGFHNLPVRWRKALRVSCHLCTGGN